MCRVCRESSNTAHTTPAETPLAQGGNCFLINLRGVITNPLRSLPAVALCGDDGRQAGGTMFNPKQETTPQHIRDLMAIALRHHTAPGSQREKRTWHVPRVTRSPRQRAL